MKLILVLLLLISLLINVSFSKYEQPLKILDTFKPKECHIKSKTGDKITVHYTGKLDNGYVFDSSIGKSPFSFKIGEHKVIKGWELGLTNMCVHQKRNLRIPPSLAYGDNDLGDIPPNSYLIFDVELIKIN